MTRFALNVMRGALNFYQRSMNIGHVTSRGALWDAGRHQPAGDRSPLREKTESASNVPAWDEY